MSRRTGATLPRGRPHIPQEDPDTPGVCLHCHRPTSLANDMHVDQLPAVDPAVLAREARQLGEREEPDA